MASSLLLALVAALALVALATSVTPVQGVSNGMLGFCDLTYYIGWSNSHFPNGNIGAGSNTAVNGGSAYMEWVTRPVASTLYTIRTADTPEKQRANDPTTYVPGKLTAIHVRAYNDSMRWTGLMMYATTEPALVRRHVFDETVKPKVGFIQGRPQNHVGSWQLPVTQDYQLTPTCQATVTHTGARVKPLHQTFYFTAPVGTGNVTLKILIKHGVQGQGRFYFPAQALVLQEAPVPAPPQSMPVLCEGGSKAAACVNASSFYEWAQRAQPISTSAIGQEGSSCAATCAAHKSTRTPFCDGVSLRAINTAAQLRGLTAGMANCRSQTLAACKYVGAPRIDPAGFCSYPAADVARTCPPAVVAASKDVAMLPEVDVCYTNTVAHAKPLCICSSHAVVQSTNPFLAAAVNKDKSAGKSASSPADATGAAASPSSGLSWLLAGAVGSVSLASPLRRSGTLSVLALLVVALASVAPVHAHNYMMSLQRATQASTMYPCIPRQSNQPHAQVIANQRFEMEWSNGHGGSDQNRPYTYVLILPASSYHELLARNMTAIMDDYIASAPPSANVAGYGDNMSGGKPNGKTQNGKLKPHQLGDQVNVRTNTQRRIDDDYFTNANMSESDNARVVREEAYWKKQFVTDGGANRQVQQQPLGNYTAADRRVAYESAKYPWINSVHKFTMFLEQHAPKKYPDGEGGGAWASRAAMAQFAVREWHGPGDFIAWYSWHGYYDCMDINVLPGDAAKGDPGVPNRYGLLPTQPSPTVTKIHHCEFTAILKASTQAYKLDPKTRDASQCINECKAANIKYANTREFGCLGVQVTRAKVAPRVPNPNGNVVPNIPYVSGHHDSSCNCHEQCYRDTVQERFDAGCVLGATDGFNTSKVQKLLDQSKLALDDDDDLLCFGLVPSIGLGAQVAEDWAIAVEPEDPAWYSTCFLVQTYGNGGFINIPPQEQAVLPTWDDAGEHCIPCDFQQQLANMNFTQVPDWAAAVAQGADSVYGSQPTLGGGCVDCSIWSSEVSSGLVRSLLAGSNLLAVPSGQTEIGAFAPQQAALPAQANNPDPDSYSSDVSTSSSGSSLPLGALIGIVAGGVVVLLFATAGAFHVYRQRASWHKHSQGMVSAQADTQMVSNPALTSW